ncbi:MAG TPA: hypothetical protein VNI55_01800 [Gaiellaceae bacterium]|nr:hypothetical protein [Gaiellaceae bacterium]
MRPRTLTRPEFLLSSAAKKPGATYEGYLSYVANRRGAAQQSRPVDPLAPLSDSTLRQQTMRPFDASLAPTSDNMIRRNTTENVRAQIDPIIAEISRSIEARAKAGMGAIGGYTNELAQNLGGFDVKARDIYADAQGRQASVNNALAESARGEGGRLQAELAGKLGAAGITDTGTSGEAARIGQGSAGASFARGGADLSELIARSASAQEYAAKLPGLARLGGLQSARTLQLESSKDLADQTGQIRSQVPGLIAELLESGRGREITKAGARDARFNTDVGLAEGARDREVNKGIARAGLQETLVKTAAASAADQAAATARARQPDTSLSNALGYLVTAGGIPILNAAGKPIQTQGSKADQVAAKAKSATTMFSQTLTTAKLDLSEKQYQLALAREERLSQPTAKTAKATGGFTAAQKQDLSAVAFDTAADDFKAKTRPVETLRDLIAAGVPFSIAVRAIQRFGRNAAADENWQATIGWTK